MSWTTPRTWEPGELVTSSQLNTHLRDNLNALFDTSQKIRCLLKEGSGQSINNNVATAMTFTTEETDIGDMHSNVSNTSRITVPVGGAGLFFVSAQVSFTPNNTGYRLLALYKNGTPIQGAESTQQQVTNQSRMSLSVATLITLADGDYLEAFVTQTSGGALTIGWNYNRFVAVRLWD